MEFLNWNSAITLRPCNVYDSIQGDESDSHIGRMRGDTMLAATQHSVNAIETF